MHARTVIAAVPLVAILSVLLGPGTVLAECTGYDCTEPVAGGVEGLQLVLLVAILVTFAVTMSVATSRRRR